MDVHPPSAPSPSSHPSPSSSSSHPSHPSPSSSQHYQRPSTTSPSSGGATEDSASRAKKISLPPG